MQQRQPHLHLLGCMAVLVTAWIVVLCLVCNAIPADAASATTPPSPSTAASHSSSSSSSSPPVVSLSASTPLTRMIFGSCNHQDRAQPFWPIIAQRRPELFVWTGDVIYADSAVFEVIRRPSPLSIMAQRYAKQKNHEGYTRFREGRDLNSGEHPPMIIGAYDDHDYGENDGDASYADKEPARHLFLDFIDEPPLPDESDTSDAAIQARATNRRARRHGGVYAAYTYGPPGQRVKLILLDGRYFQNHTTGDMLGETQWEWLRQQLDDPNECDLIILTSGVQIVATDKRIGEGWRQMPQSRARLFDLIATRQGSQNAAVMLLSGDIHFAEADVTYVCKSDDGSSATEKDGRVSGDGRVRVTPLYEFTSSGLTHSIGTQITRPLAEWALKNFILDERESWAEEEEKKKQKTKESDSQQRASNSDSVPNSIRGVYTGLNVGQLDIDWNVRRVNVSIIDVNDQAALHYSLTFHAFQTQTFTSVDQLPHIIQRKCRAEDVRKHSAPPLSLSGIKFFFTALFTVSTALTVVALALTRWRKRGMRHAQLGNAAQKKRQ